MVLQNYSDEKCECVNISDCDIPRIHNEKERHYKRIVVFKNNSLPR